MTAVIEAEKPKKKRKEIAKGIRFEVLKRDSFRCQYCGVTAPDVVLHIDHIEAVANGGTNDLTNLITSCEGCNLGKSDTPLDDHAAVKKSRAQLDDLQQRREQLEMMMEWRKGLRQLDRDGVNSLASYWHAHVPGWRLNESGEQKLAKLAKKFSVAEICAAMDDAARVYVKIENGEATKESQALAFNKLGGVCAVSKASAENPDLKDLFYIRGILRNRIPGYFNPPKAMEFLKAARSWDVSLGELGHIARNVRNWSGFVNAICKAIDGRKEAA